MIFPESGLKYRTTIQLAFSVEMSVDSSVITLKVANLSRFTRDSLCEAPMTLVVIAAALVRLQETF